MGWTDPSGHIYAVSEVVTAATLNTYSEANLAFLYGDAAWTGVAAGTLYVNSWVDIGGAYLPVAFRKIGTRVVLRGIMASGTGMVAAFTLPIGYRPTLNTQFPVVSNSLFGFVIIGSNGSVVPTVGSTVSFSLDGISFDTI